MSHDHSFESQREAAAGSFSADRFSADRFSADLGGIHVVFGAGMLERLGPLVLRLPELAAVGSVPRRVLVVTDPGLEAAGHVDRAMASLADAGLDAAIFDGVEENPTTEHVERGVEAARSHDADLLIGLGGGSSMDCCKGINFLLTQDGDMEDFRGVGKAARPMLPSVGVPTTAGTGSEAQRFALISQAESHVKMACGDRKARFRLVILDPELIRTVPRRVAAANGMDALAHAVESHASRARTPFSAVFSREAFRLAEGALETYLDARDGDGAEHEQARADLLLAAHLAGSAIEHSMLGAAHSLANPLTARHGVIHGVAVGYMLPHVVRFNADAAVDAYEDLAHTAGLDLARHANAAEAVAKRLEELYRRAGLPDDLAADADVDTGALDAMAEEAAGQWTARFNPRPADAGDMASLYAAAFAREGVVA